MNITTKIRNALSTSRKAAGDLSDGLESVRARIAKLREEHEHIALAPPTLDQALARVDQFVTDIGRPIEDFYIGSFMAAADYRRPDTFRQVDVLALAASAELLGEKLKARLRRQYDKTPDGLTDADRKAKLSALDRELLDLELVEESLIRSAETAGFDVLRRHDADPAAVLADDSALPQ
jgi:hypothetical protein